MKEKIEEHYTELSFYNFLRNKSVFITGGTSGIGAELVYAYSALGAQVCFIGTNTDKAKVVLERTEKEQANNSSTFYFQADVSSKEEVEKSIACCLEKWGKIDILINNAGITRDGLLLRMKDEEIEEVFDVNIKGCFYTCRAALRSMIREKSGKVINVSSIVGLMGNAGQTNYAASKAALIGFTKSLAKEVASRGITVNAVAPGFIETPMTQTLQAEKRAALIDSIPLKRMGTTHDIVYPILFLSTPMADYITGQTLIIDGGLYIYH